jgi:hypothetical protein
VSPERLELETSSQNGCRQLVVTAKEGAGRVWDVTRDARYEISPPDLATADRNGRVTAAREGRGVIRIEAAGCVCELPLVVRTATSERSLHFGNDVVPVFTRYGCNAGGCHGKASGQNGFKLSLFGFDPAADYDGIVREDRGRRVFPARPELSTILLKPTARVPHAGGRLFGTDSEAYDVIKRWLAQGMPVGKADAPTLKRVEVVPSSRVLGREARQQLAVLAHYSDGSVHDVTHRAQYQSNLETVASVDPDGQVRTSSSTGEAAVMARYQGQVAVFRATVPLDTVNNARFEFPASNYVDTLAAGKWRSLGLTPAELCTDGVFIRRVTLDLCGKLPTVDEVRVFVADASPNKRANLIDQRLEDESYAAYFALRWASILRNSVQADSEQVAYAFHAWIREMIATNRPYDEFVRGVVAAAGEWQDAPAINWYWQMRDDPLHQPTADTAQVFLGLRLQCAKCHHHPYERWSQDDYYGLAGFFTRVGRKSFGQPPPHFASRTVVVGDAHPRTGGAIEPKLLDGPEVKVTPGDDPRHKLVDWMASAENPFFAKALCNRMWGHLMGRGLVDPIDDMRETNPPSNPDLLEALARDFREHRFDVKHLLRTICNSRTYQLSAVPNDNNRHDRQNHARYYAKRLIAEVFLDAVDRVTETKTEFGKVPKRARAIELPHEGFGSYILDVFDRPTRTSSCECARSSGASLQQVLYLSNSGEIEDKLAADTGRIARLVNAGTTPETAIEELYVAAFARVPTPEELQKARAHLEKQSDTRRGLEDIAWVLINSREFMFNH